VAGLDFHAWFPAYWFLLFFGMNAWGNRRRSAAWPPVREVLREALRESAPDRRATPRGIWRVIVWRVRAGCERDEYVRGLLTELASRAVAAPRDDLPRALPIVLFAGVSEETAREIVAALGKVDIDAVATRRTFGLPFMGPRDLLRQVLLVAPAPILAVLAGFPSRRGGLVVIVWSTLVAFIEIWAANRRMGLLAPALQLPPNA
jgi:hypothetical protein